MCVGGANNISVPMGEHVFSIGFAMAFGYVTKFLNQGLTGDRLWAVPELPFEAILRMRTKIFLFIPLPANWPWFQNR